MKTNEEWKAWGDLDPLYAVASWAGKKKKGANPWTDEEFYALGVDWNSFCYAWQANAPFKNGSVLEIGCGAGRLTQMLAAQFQYVTAADVSPGMIAYAKEHVTVANVNWQVTDGNKLPAGDATMDAVFSCHVFQHFPDNESQLRTFAEIFRVLKPGGSFLVHIAMHEFPQVNRGFIRFGRLAYRTFLGLRDLKAAAWRFLTKFGAPPYIYGTSYEMRPLQQDLRKLGFQDVGLVGVLAKSGFHTCVFGRKP